MKRGLTGTLIEIEDAKRAVHSQERIATKSNASTKLLIESFEAGWTIAFYDLLRDLIEQRISSEDPSQHILLQFPASAFIYEYRKPALSDEKSQSTLLTEQSSIRFSRRVGAEAEFYGSGKVSMGDITLKSDEIIEPTMKNLHFPVWLANANTFVTVPDILR